MTTREEVTWVCDLCDRAVEVETHELSVDGVTIEVDACERCWKKPGEMIDMLAAAGRVTGRRRKRKVRA